MTWIKNPQREFAFLGLQHSYGQSGYAELRAGVLELMVVCSEGHVTWQHAAANYGTGSWCIRDNCRSTRTYRLGEYPAIIAYMMLAEATRPPSEAWTDEEVYQMAKELGAWASTAKTV